MCVRDTRCYYKKGHNFFGQKRAKTKSNVKAQLAQTKHA